MKKLFVLDTNVLLHSPECLTAFADNDVILPIEVIEELDRFKRNADEKGRNARQVTRTLDRLRNEGRLGEGVPLASGGSLRVLVQDTTGERVPGINPEIMDNRIIRAAFFLQKHQDRQVIFVSKDINARIKADAAGLAVADFEKQKINFDEIYSGWRRLPVAGSLVDRFYSEGALDVPGDWELLPNEFVLLENEANPKHTGMSKYLAATGQLVPLFHHRVRPWGIKARNLEQTFAIELLLCDEIKLVTLMGQAGTGKTLLALACGVTKVVEEKVFAKLLVSRPIIPFGRDIGFLPGDKDEKMRHWMQPIFDNLRFLASANGEDTEGRVEGLLQARGGKTIEIEALTYIRGRSLPNQYMIIDEAQNLTPLEVKTIISRAGEGTKVILTGDPYQIDSPYLDASSNGLSYTVERMKGQPLFGHITLSRSERSELASVAAQLL
ncbi:MAG: PhoH family protein [Thermodesulfobacteriota bacterium]